jgi:hypothetical protein
VIARYRESDLGTCIAFQKADALTYSPATIIIVPVKKAIRESSAGRLDRSR